MAELKAKQNLLIQLFAFLESRPLSGFPDIKTFRKVASAADMVRAELGEFYPQYADLEGKWAVKITPYHQEVAKCRQQNADEEAQKPILADIEKRAAEDKDLQKAAYEFDDFKIKDGEKEISFSFKNPEYIAAMKSEFEAHGLKWDHWTSKAAFMMLADLLDQI